MTYSFLSQKDTDCSTALIYGKTWEAYHDFTDATFVPNHYFLWAKRLDTRNCTTCSKRSSIDID